SLTAIAVTTFLAIWIQSSTAALQRQASLLDLTHDAVFVRDLNDVIIYWNLGAEKLYGWPASSALAKLSHQTIQPDLPAPYDQTKSQLRQAGYWAGDLAHTRRDGTKVTVSSGWSLQRDGRGHPMATLETNTDVEAQRRAQEDLIRTQAELTQLSRAS